MKFKLIVILIFVLCTYLGLKGLGNTYFWDDESIIAYFAGNLLRFGVLTGWDGRNMMAYNNGRELNNDLISNYTPPLQCYITALSFYLLGISTWVGRLPFVIFGLLSLLIFFLLLRKDFEDKKQAALWIYALATLCFSSTFLLNIRQCKYYALGLFFPLAIFYGYRLWLTTKKVRWLILITAASILFFYSSLLLCAAFLFSLAALHLLFYSKGLTAKDWLKLFLAVISFILSTLQYAIWQFSSPVKNSFSDRITLLWWNVRDLNLINCLPWMIAAGLAYCLIKHKKEKDVADKALQWGVLIFGYILFLSLFSPQPIAYTRIADVRYLMPVVPFLAGLIGIFLWFIHRKNKLLAVILLLILVNTNFLTLTPSNNKFRWLLPAYIYEIHHSYPTCYSESADFLFKNAKQDDLVYAFPEYCNYPLIFYSGDKFKFGCLLNYNTTLNVDKMRRLDSVLFIEENFPQWFIMFGRHLDALNLLNYFSRPHYENDKFIRYDYQAAATLDVYWQDMSRPELPWHNFGPKKDFDRNTEAVYIYKRSSPIEVTDNVL